MPLGKRGRITVASVAVVAVVAVSAGTYALTRSDGKGEAEREHSGSHEMREAMEKHPSLGDHRLPLAFVAEKLEQQGGEASGEIKNGPSQETYDQRALPRKTIAPAQQKGAEPPSARRGAGPRPPRAGPCSGRRRAGRPPRPPSPPGPRPDRTVVCRSRRRPTPAPRRTSPGAPPPSPPGTAAARATACSTRAPPAADCGRPRNALAATRPGSTSAPTSRRRRSARSTGRRTRTASTSAPASRTAPRTPRPGSACTSRPTVRTPSRRCPRCQRQGLHPRPVGGRGRRRPEQREAHHGRHRRRAARLLLGQRRSVHASRSREGGSVRDPQRWQTWELTLSQESDAVDPARRTERDFFRGGISKIEFDPNHAGQVYAAMFDYGLFRGGRAGNWKRSTRSRPPATPPPAWTAGSSSPRRRCQRQDPDLPGRRDVLRRQRGGAPAHRRRNGDQPDVHAALGPDPGHPGYGSYNFCQGQCSYDMAVATPPGRPDEVFLSGSMNYDELQAFGGPGSSNGRSSCGPPTPACTSPT